MAKVDLPRARVGHDLRARAFDDHLAEMQERDPVREAERHVHVVLDHHGRDLPRDLRQQATDVEALLRRQAGEGLVEEQHLRVLRQRHGDLDPAPLAVGRLGQRPVLGVVEADPGERRLGPLDEIGAARERRERVPARRRQSEQRQRHVAQDRVHREQGDDLVGPRQPEMGPQPARSPRDVSAEQVDAAARGSELAGDEVEQRRLAGAVRADDQAPLSRLDVEVDVAGDLETSEGLAQVPQDKGAHRESPAVDRAAASGAGRAGRLRHVRHSRAVPGTRPSGMKLMIRTKMIPSTMFQRST